MSHKKRTLLFIILLIVIILTTCGRKEDGDIEKDTVTIVDNRGEKVQIPKDVERIVCLSPEATEIMGELNSLDKLVGVVNECDYPEEVEEIETVGSFSSPSYEKILSLEPDMIIATGLEQESFVNRLSERDIPVVVFYSKTLSDVKKNILLMGKIVKSEERALRIVEEFEGVFDDIHQKLQQIPEEERETRVYIEISPDPLMTVAKGSFVHDVITSVGGENIGEDLPREYCRIDPEVVIKSDPEFIIILHEQIDKDGVASRNGWNVITAVQRGNIITDLNPDILLRATPRLAEGALQLYQAIHPDEERSVFYGS